MGDARNFVQRMRDQRPLTRNLHTSGHIHRIETVEHSFENHFSHYDTLNMEMSMDMKIVASSSSPYVVSISSYRAGTRIFACSGFIIECSFIGDKFHGMILTSGVISRDHENDIEIHVCLSNSTAYEGKVVATNLHYNLSMLKIECDTPLSVATLRCIGDSFHLSSGETVMVLGQYYEDSCSFMAAAGLFSAGSCGLDCEELLRVVCRISKSGIGGPAINSNGEVIGIAFYASAFTPVLPINIAVKWWQHVKQNKVIHLPHLGIKVRNLNTADAGFREMIDMKFSNICNGVIVKKVKKRSVAGLASIQPKDVLVECSGQTVRSSLQFLDLIWDRVGECIDFSFIRPVTGSSYNLRMIVDELGEAEFNRWPLPRKRAVSRLRYPAW